MLRCQVAFLLKKPEEISEIYQSLGSVQACDLMVI